MDSFQKEVAEYLSDVLPRSGFALGGGQALGVHLGTNRPSKDLDYYQRKFESAPYEEAEASLKERLESKGYRVTLIKTMDTFRAFDVEKDGESVRVDLGFDARIAPPVFVTGVGPVLSEEDVVYGKVRALIDRETERDFVDLAAILESGRWNYADVLRLARSYDASVSPSKFREILKRAHLGDPVEYAAAGVRDLSTLLNQLSSAGCCRVCNRSLRSVKSIEAGVGPKCAKKSR